MKRLKALRLRFALWTAGLLFAALVLFGLFVYANMSRTLTAAVDDILQSTASDLTDEVELLKGEPVFLEDPTMDPQYTRLHEQGFSLRILNLTGQPVQEYGPYRDLPQSQLDFSAPDQSGKFAVFVDPGTQDLVHVFTAPIVKENGVAGTLQVALNLETVTRTLDLLLTTFLLGVPLIVIVGGIGGYFLAARALAPIDKITRTARQISANDLSTRLNMSGTEDEVGRLAATLDSMLDRLDDAFRRERQFTADASHELRTPLSAAQTIIGSTLARQRTPVEYEQALIDLSQEVERMTLLTEELLQLARQDAGWQPTRLERVDLSTLLRDVVDSLRPLAEDKGLQLVDHIPDDGLTLMGDRDSLIRLFVNLLENAIKYTEQGIITVSAQRKNDERLAVTICDTGVGIAPEHLPHIFDRFYRVDESRSKDGLGLGLAIVQNIARAHGGDAIVESKVGEGTTFIVQLSAK